MNAGDLFGRGTRASHPRDERLPPFDDSSVGSGDTSLDAIDYARILRPVTCRPQENFSPKEANACDFRRRHPER